MPQLAGARFPCWRCCTAAAMAASEPVCCSRGALPQDCPQGQASPAPGRAACSLVQLLKVSRPEVQQLRPHRRRPVLCPDLQQPAAADGSAACAGTWPPRLRRDSRSGGQDSSCSGAVQHRMCVRTGGCPTGQPGWRNACSAKDAQSDQPGQHDGPRATDLAASDVGQSPEAGAALHAGAQRLHHPQQAAAQLGAAGAVEGQGQGERVQRGTCRNSLRQQAQRSAEGWLQHRAAVDRHCTPESCQAQSADQRPRGRARSMPGSRKALPCAASARTAAASGGAGR